MKETRTVEVRAAQTSADGGGMVIEGTPIVYGEKTEIHDPAGDYFEVISRGALDGADMTDCRLCYNHDLNHVPLARTPKTMAMAITDGGLDVRATLPDTEEARSVYEAIKRGDLDGMSFAFTVPQDGSKYDPQTNTRTITRIAKVYEVSVVPFPAYQGTSVEARAQIQREVTRRDVIISANKILIGLD